MIRVLADRSKDASGGAQFANLLPYSEFACADSRLPLEESLLADYDLLAICGESLKPYASSELEAIRRFVERGGGLLLAAGAPSFEFEANQPPQAMAQNSVAALFGAAFLSADCEGAKADPSLQVGFSWQQLSLHEHPALAEAGVGLVIGLSGPISPPQGAAILAAHKATGQPVAAAFEFGEGRVVVVGASSFADWGRLFTCRALARWLAAGRRTHPEREASPPQYLGPRRALKRGDYFHLVYDQSCADQVDDTLALLERVNQVGRSYFGQNWKPPQDIGLLDSLRAWGSAAGAGAQAPKASRARTLLHGLLSRGVKRYEFYECLDAVFSIAPWRTQLLVELLKELGEAEEAARCQDRADRWLAEMDGRAKVFDLARNYTWTQEGCPRGLLVFREFGAELGKDAIAKLPAAFPEKDPWKHLPVNYAWPSDRAIYYLSLALGKDLFPWFAARGLTVHPLPLIRPDAEDVGKQMQARLKEALRDEAEALSSRMDAALDLSGLTPEQGRGADDWSALCQALKLAKQADRRAAGQLRKLFAETNPPALRAIAGLALADLGEASVGEELVPLARRFDPRFQLAAWYALAKAGSPRADELSLDNLRDSSGSPIGELEVEFDGFLRMHCKVEGYRANNIFSLPTPQLFTKDAAISSLDVHWVHTSPLWRRCGLARYTMEKTMNHPAAMRCSCSGLGTGTRNVAHRLYRDFGLTDMQVSEEWSCELPGSAPARLPTGVSFREYAEGDAPRLAAFCWEQRGKAMNPDGLLRGELDPRDLAFLAEKAGELVGCIITSYSSGDAAQLRRLVVKQDDQRDAIADALIALPHRKARELGAKRMSCWNLTEDRQLLAALNRAGYQVRPTGGVWLMQVRHLVQFLQEISPVLEKRLADSDFKDWKGSIDLVAGRLKARLSIAKAKVSVSAPAGRRARVVLRCDDDTATRVALGRETPFQAYLQARLDIKPRISDQIVKLLETVFPIVEAS